MGSSLGSITDSLGNIGDSGSGTGKITDTIAETIGDLVATALKSVLGNMS